MQLHGAGPTMHPLAFPLFIDTFYYAIDGLFSSFLGSGIR